LLKGRPLIYFWWLLHFPRLWYVCSDLYALLVGGASEGEAFSLTDLSVSLSFSFLAPASHILLFFLSFFHPPFRHTLSCFPLPISTPYYYAPLPHAHISVFLSAPSPLFYFASLWALEGLYLIAQQRHWGNQNWSWQLSN